MYTTEYDTNLLSSSFLYVLQPNATSVAVLRLDAPGKASNVGNFNLKDAADASGLTISMSRMLAQHVTRID